MGVVLIVVILWVHGDSRLLSITMVVVVMMVMMMMMMMMMMMTGVKEGQDVVYDAATDYSAQGGHGYFTRQITAYLQYQCMPGE